MSAFTMTGEQSRQCQKGPYVLLGKTDAQGVFHVSKVVTLDMPRVEVGTSSIPPRPCMSKGQEFTLSFVVTSVMAATIALLLVWGFC